MCASFATSSRRSPGVRRRPPADSPTSAGESSSRRRRRKSPSCTRLFTLDHIPRPVAEIPSALDRFIRGNAESPILRMKVLSLRIAAEQDLDHLVGRAAAYEDAPAASRPLARPAVRIARRRRPALSAASVPGSAVTSTPGPSASADFAFNVLMPRACSQAPGVHHRQEHPACRDRRSSGYPSLNVSRGTNGPSGVPRGRKPAGAAEPSPRRAVRTAHSWSAARLSAARRHWPPPPGLSAGPLPPSTAWGTDAPRSRGALMRGFPPGQSGPG